MIELLYGTLNSPFLFTLNKPLKQCLFKNINKLASSKTNLDGIVEKVSLESRTEGFITEEKINKAINFIYANYNKPYANAEVLDKLLYYTEYLNKVGAMKKNNAITDLSKLVRQYMNDQEDATKKDIEAKIKYVKEHQDSLIKELTK